MGVKLLAAEVERHGPVGIVKINPVERMMERSLEPDCDEFIEVHTAISIALEELRFDKSIRIIVITGSKDDEFYVAPKASHYTVEKFQKRLGLPHKEGRPSEYRAQFRPVANYVETLLNCEKPIIARVNGDVIGAGQSVMWGCDIIVAREDAVISDVHMGMGEVIDRHGNNIGFPWAVNPGDGAMAFAQQNFSSYKYKEYQYLSQVLTARELADMNIINYAVPADQLDAKVDDLIQRLLARPQSALTRVRKLLQKPIVAQANLQYDLSAEYEHADFSDHRAQGHFAPDWRPTLTKDTQLPRPAIGKPESYSE